MNQLESCLRKLFNDYLLEVSDHYIGCASHEEVNEVSEMKRFILQTLKLMDEGYRVDLVSPGERAFIFGANGKLK